MSDFLNRVEAQKLPREKVFRDPVHGYIYIQDGVIIDLINTREFQRLRRIKQLGGSGFTFHGAEHSRFNHSLGVYELTRRIVNTLEERHASSSPHDGLWQTEERLVLLCAALLHDVGHGPFSHTFEGIFNTDHETITQDIILSPETEIHQLLVDYFGEAFPHKVASVINKTYDNPQVVQLISSQIDADRMDYLLRDAYYAGVSYGTFDLTRILRVIRPYNNKIVFDFTGMHAIEDYIISRYQMYMQVYFHPVSRGMEVVLHKLLSRAKYCYLTSTQMKHPVGLLEPFLKGNWTLTDYLRLDDHILSSYFNHWCDEEDDALSDLATRFITRKPFKSILVNPNELVQLSTAVSEELKRNGFNPAYYFEENSSYDLPYDYYRTSSRQKRTQIELITKNNQLVELSLVSPLVNSLAGKARGDLRLYFPHELLTTIESTPTNMRTENQHMIASARFNERNDVTHEIQQRLF